MPFEISGDFTAAQKATVEEAIDHWNQRTIMRLVARQGQVDYVVFQPAEGSCSSVVGRASGAQAVACDVLDGFRRGSVIHEIGHAAGFYHEHTRPDRDLFVDINIDNVEVDARRNYEIRMNGVLLTEYDYGSIMHYGRRGGFAIDPSVDIITPTAPGATIGQRDGLSTLDLLGVLGLYDAPHYAVAWEDDAGQDGDADIWWAGLTRWGSYCGGQQQRIHNAGDNNRAPSVAVDMDRNSMIAFEHRKSDKTHISMRALRPDGEQHFGGSHHSAPASTGNGAPNVATHASGDFVLVWHEDRDARRWIKARGYFNDGTTRFPLQTLASDDTGTPALPTVGMANDRSFVVAWAELLPTDSLVIRARRFDRDGVALSAELLVDDQGIGDQDVFPRIAVASDGAFYVVYERGLRDVFLAGFDATNAPLFAPMRVSSTATGRQYFPDIGITSLDQLVVVWTDDRNQNGLGQIRARVLARDGSVIKRDFTVNTRGGGDQRRPRVATGPDGGYVVVWEDDRGNDGVYQVHAQVFDVSHTKSGGPQTVNQIPTGTQTGPGVGA